MIMIMKIRAEKHINRQMLAEKESKLDTDYASDDGMSLCCWRIDVLKVNSLKKKHKMKRNKGKYFRSVNLLDQYHLSDKEI